MDKNRTPPKTKLTEDVIRSANGTKLDVCGIRNQKYSRAFSQGTLKRPPLLRTMSTPHPTSPFRLANIKKSTLAKDKSKEKNLVTVENPKCAKKPVLARSISLGTPDVITLVSLVSSEGSESEDSECMTTFRDPTKILTKTPKLNKNNKSVSFLQENNEDFNFHMLKKSINSGRRISSAPLSERILRNRPPISALKAFNSFNKIETNASSSQINGTGHSTSIFSKYEFENSQCRGPFRDLEKIPEYVQKHREHYCWKLFQKMSEKGVVISYETILRGMLTPTEFRQLETRELKKEQAENTEELIEGNVRKYCKK